MNSTLGSVVPLAMFRDLGDVAVLDLGSVAQLLPLDPLRSQARGTDI